jgi:hypothetical protein
MENELNETGVVVRVEPATWQSQGKPVNLAGEKEPIGSSSGLIWTNPAAASERLVRQLLEIVNTQDEYELLQRDLEQLHALCPSCSNVLKGGAAQSAGTR